MTSSLETLPPELFPYILAYLSPEDTSALSQTCHRMNIVTRDDKIWRQYFVKRYTYSTLVPQYSDEEYLPGSALKFTEPPDNYTWQEYFIQRSFQDKHIRSVLNEIISTRINRRLRVNNYQNQLYTFELKHILFSRTLDEYLRKYNTDLNFPHWRFCVEESGEHGQITLKCFDFIHFNSMFSSNIYLMNCLGIYNAELLSSTYGLLAVDVLKHYFPPPIDTSKQNSTSSRNLTREYYSLELTRLISREVGLILLDKMNNRREIHTEGKALINALFVIQCFHPHGILLSLNRLHSIGKRLLNDPIFPTLNLNEKCQLIMTTMKAENFLPANGDNSSGYYDLENSFLFSTFNGKPTIPLTLVSIFCALAEECNLIARPIGFPGEVMAQVDQSSTSNDFPDNAMPLIISVYDGKILSLNEINDRLFDVIDRPLTHPLSITPIIDLVIRSARNMINSITEHSTSSLNSYGVYAAVSTLKILGAGALPFTFDSMMNVLKEHFPMDMYFFAMLSSPMTTPSDNLRRIQNEDSNPSSIEAKHRKDSSPKFSIGQIFQHQQYNYWGVICGWDLICMASPLWQIRMGIENLTRAASQPFYHILADDSSRRYVAEDNINTLAFISNENEEEKYSIVQKLCAADGIGRQFERVDIAKAIFIPNNELRNEYPDDFV